MYVALFGSRLSQVIPDSVCLTDHFNNCNFSKHDNALPDDGVTTL